MLGFTCTMLIANVWFLFWWCKEQGAREAWQDRRVASSSFCFFLCAFIHFLLFMMYRKLVGMPCMDLFFLFFPSLFSILERINGWKKMERKEKGGRAVQVALCCRDVFVHV